MTCFQVSLKFSSYCNTRHLFFFYKDWHILLYKDNYMIIKYVMSCHVMSCHVLDIQYSEWIFFRMDRSVRFSTLRNMCDYSSNLSICRSARFFLLKPCDLDSTLYMFPIHFSHTCIKYPYNQQNMPSSFLFVFLLLLCTRNI